MSSQEDTWWVELGRNRKVRANQLPGPLLACVTLIDFMTRTGQQLIVDRTYQQLVVGTVSRSFDTFTGICGSLYDEKPIQDAMLCRPLFEDVVVVHWLLYNDSDPAWLVGRYERQRQAMPLYQRKLADRTAYREYRRRGARGGLPVGARACGGPCATSGARRFH